MEHLLRLSGSITRSPFPWLGVTAHSFPVAPFVNGYFAGLLSDDDNGATDLGTLEKKLVEKQQQSRQASQAASNPTSPSQATSGQDANSSASRSSLASPEPAKGSDKGRSVTPEKDNAEEEQEEVSELSEMMCSLVTNNYGETRYIGTCARSECGAFVR